MRLCGARRAPVYHGAAALALALALGAAAALADASRMVVEDWSSQPADKRGIPDGWKGQSWGSPKYDFAIQQDEGARVLHLKSAGDSSNINKEVKIDLKEYPILEWRWKVTALPAGADLRKKETDDEAAQLYVVFPRFPAAVRSQIIGYVWDTTAPVGLISKSTKTGTVTYVVVRSGTADLGRWITERRNVWDDYRRIYGSDPDEPVGGISLGIDSDDTKSRAESFFGPITFLKRSP
ncbi:MAG TPA: DUF3047 domain-containing protein [Candidatus Binatia bacterium]|nr:DUF3047 domain-containing protein [Candidatus Binatia bacterium]